MSDESELWVEKYRPQKLSTFVGNKDNISLIKKWMNDFANKSPDFKPILLLIGEPGVGKTTLAHLIMNEFNYDIIEINASKLEGKSEIHKHFDNITRKGIGVLYSKTNKIGVVLDEVDGMAQNETTMKEFLSIIDPIESNKDGKIKKAKQKAKKQKTVFGFAKNKKQKKSDDSDCDMDDELSYDDIQAKKYDEMVKNFDKMKKEKEEEFFKFPFKYPIICTANKASDKRMKKLAKRSEVIVLRQPTKPVFYKFAQKIVKSENIDIKPDALDLLVDRSNFDFRQLISNLQMVAMQDNVSVEDVNILVKGRDIDQNLFDIVHDLLNTENSVEDITLSINNERRPICNMIYHNIINVIDYNRNGKKKDKIDILSKIMESIADGQRYDQYLYDDNNTYNIVKNIIEPIMLSQELKITNKLHQMESYNIQNYKSQEAKTYSNYIAYFIDKFGTLDTKTVFQLCYIIISELYQAKQLTDIQNTKSIRLMKEYDIGVDDINKMCKICALIPDINVIQSKIDTAKFRKMVQASLNKV